MESVTHSRLPNEAYSAFPRKASSLNKGGFPAKTMYDDVYGGPPNFGFTTFSPRAEDYCEIFSGFHASHASSIPVLDLPAVDETQVGLDVRSSGFNYAEIFGGFNGLDFEIFYEDLLSGQSDGRDGYASEQAWTLAETGTSSEESEPHGNSPILSNEDPYKPFDGTAEFSISYHKVNRTRNEVMSSGRTHLTELQAVHGYSLLYDETASVQKTNPQLQATDDADLCTSFRTAKMMGYHESNTKSQTANCSSIEQTLGNGPRVGKSLTRNSSRSNKDFVTVSEITLRTQPCQVQPPSRPPPTPVNVRKEYPSRFSSSSTQNTCQRISGDNSPPFFDVEIDVGSSASASVCSMQEPIVKAQEQLGSVKHLAGKQEVPGGQVKPGLKFVFNGNKGTTQETANILDDLDFEEPRCTYNRSQCRSKVSVNAEPIVSKTTHEIHDSLEEDILLDITKRPTVEKHIGETFSSLQWTNSSTISGKQKGIIQSSEPVSTQYFVHKSEPNIGQIFSRDMEVHECPRMERKDAIDEVHSQVKTVQEIHHPKDYGAKHKAQKEVYQHMEIIRQQRAANSKCKKTDVETGYGSTGTSMKEKKESEVRMVHDCVETKGETSQSNPSLKVQNMMKIQQVQNKLTEGAKKAEKQHETENDLKLKEYVRKQGVDKCMDNMKGRKESGRKKDRKQRKKAAIYLGQVDDRERQKNDMETAEKGLGLEESFEQDEEAHRNDIEKTLQNVDNQKQSGNKSTMAIEKDEDHKKSHGGEANEGSPKVSLQNEEILKAKMKLLKEERKKMLTDTLAQEENIIRVEEACESDENKNRGEEADSCQTTKKEVSQSKRKQGVEKVTKEDGENRCNDIANLEQKGQNVVMKRIESNEEEIGLNSASKIDLHGEYVELMVCGGAWTVEGYDNLHAHSASKHEHNSGNVEGSQVRDGECGKGTNSEIWVSKTEAEILKNQPADRQVCLPSIITEDIERGIFSENEAKLSFLFNGNLNNASDANICLGVGRMWNGEIENVFQSYTGPKNLEMFNHESVGRQKNDQDVSNTVNKEELGEKLTLGNSEINFENEFKIGATESTILKGKENAQLPSQQCNLSQDAERKEKNLNSAPTVEIEYERARREKEMEIDRLRKLEEEREREREKDRMAVGKASLEGHGKAYAEACERAERAALERAAAESRQKLLAEARVRLEKACAEAKEKSFSDKVEPETRLKADRIAVDRAIAEARERALDGVKAERAVLDAREQLERSVSADFSAALRNKGGKPAASFSDGRDEQFQNVVSRFPYSSTGASSFVEKSGGFEGESAKRCRVRLDRYRRTAEQAAKALAEKNMRDLLAQKEQAERNRLAETLDAEVKRWSSGKEGNLRALLSTLQYILGPNSGWQPIPLTEVITSAAVKKAYRKATLCVHPDKLQQRGASIQHKYICEKVFDLLKDAWNKFNSVEL